MLNDAEYFKWFYDNEEAINKERRELANTLDGIIVEDSELPEVILRCREVDNMDGLVAHALEECKKMDEGTHAFIGENYIFYGNSIDVYRIKNVEDKYRPEI